VFKKCIYAGIIIFSSLPQSLIILKNERTKFKVTLSKHVNAHSFYSFFVCVKIVHQFLYTCSPGFSYIINCHALIRLSYVKFGLSYTADKKTYRAIAQWRFVDKTTSSDFVQYRQSSDVCTYSSVCLFVLLCSGKKLFERATHDAHIFSQQ